MMNNFRGLLDERELAIELTDGAKLLLVERGYDPNFGARPLRRVIQQMIVDRISEGLLVWDFNPGDLIHVDVKKLGRVPAGGGHRHTGRGPGRHHGKGGGWDYVHVCVDDATRLAYVELLADEQTTTVLGFLAQRSGSTSATASASNA